MSGLGGSLRSVTQLLSADAFAKLVGVGTLAFYARYLDKPSLALLPVYEILSGAVAIVFGLGLLPTLVRRMPAALERDPREARALARATLLLVSCGAGLAGLGVYLAALPLAGTFGEGEELAGAIRIMAPGFVAFALRRAGTYLLWASSRFDRMSVLTAAYACGGLLAAGLLAWGGLEAWMWGLVLRDALTATAALWFARDLLRGPAAALDLPGLIRESLPFYAEAYLMYLTRQGDQWIVGAALGPAALAIYYVAKRLYTLLFSVYEAIDRVVTANVLRRRESPEALGEHLEQVFLVLSQTAVPLVFAAIAGTPVVLALVAGPDFGAALLPSILLFGVILTEFARQPLNRAIFALRSPSERFKLTFVESASLLPLLLLLAPPLAENGAALARLAASTLAGIYAAFVVRRTIQVGVPWRALGGSLLASALVAGGLLGLQLHDPSLVRLPLYGLGAALLFLVLTSLLNSSAFYGTWNAILPFRVIDPLRALLRRGA